MKSITLIWLKKKHACRAGIQLFENKFGKKATVREVVDCLHEIKRPDWEAWLLSQTLSLTVAMVKHGTDIHACKDLALCVTAKSGRFKIVRYLIEQGADIHAYKDLSLCLAADSGCLKIVQYLLEQGADIRACEDYTIYLATNLGHTGVVNFLKKAAKK